MSRPGCPRAWQAEAVEDGRLSGAERLSFERHLTGCPVCADEVAASARLRELMQHAPALTSTPLEQQRRRGALLSRANQAMVGTSPRAVRRWLVAGGSVAALCAVLVGTRYSLSGTVAWRAPKPAVEHASAPKFEIVGLEGAQWIEQSAGSVARAVLNRGSLAVHVQHLTAGQRFLLALPDGEIEVYGTRFVVAIVNHRTHRVEVSEGVVALRLHGQPEQLLNSGSHWDRPSISVGAPTPRPELVSEPSKTAAAEATRVKPESPAASSPPATIALRRLSNQPPPNRRGDVSRSDVTPGRTPTRSSDDRTAQQPKLPETKAAPRTATSDDLALPSQRFAEAVAAFHAGAYEDAKLRLAGFAHDFPQDGRSEDVAFLRAVAALRAGDKTQAAALAREYLRRFPNGLRRHEADRILRDASKH